MSTPGWNIETEYPSLRSPEFGADLEEVKEGLRLVAEELSTLLLSDEADANRIRSVLRRDERIRLIYDNLLVYVNCLLSTNANDEEARAQLSALEALGSRRAQLLAPVIIFLQRCPEAFFASIVADPELAGNTFKWQRAREEAVHLLSPEEEVLLQAMRPAGHKAWDNLYQELSGKGKCRLELSGGTQAMGLAEAQGLLYGADREKRKAAWHGIQGFWREHQSSAAAILNALAGWRLEESRRRSHTRPQHFLDPSLRSNRITRATLDALMEACHRNLPQLRRAGKLMARTLGEASLAPWDLIGASPVAENAPPRSYAEGLDLVRSSFAAVDPSLGDFVRTMDENNWIEAKVRPAKRGGAYCTRFPKSRTPRVFQTYLGSLPNVQTLAHELGHGFHSWSLRDLPRSQQYYPMTLAETASVFGEAALRDFLQAKARSREELLEVGWGDLRSIMAYLVNIPARFDFENSFYERRQERSLSPDDLSALTDEAWNRWYGDVLSENEPLFWATKLHFSIADLSFYNYPYSFGYLFSLAIYARKESLGDRFAGTYVSILRDTGRMTAEDLVQKHLGEDLSDPKFWQAAIDGEIAKIDRYEALL